MQSTRSPADKQRRVRDRIKEIAEIDTRMDWE